MADSHGSIDDLKKLYERLYTDSHFRLSRLKNDPTEAANETRNLIRQTEMHCSIQNISQDGVNDMKNKLISEYTTIVDTQKQEGLLPFIADDGNWIRSLTKYKNTQSDMQNALKTCVKFVEKTLHSCNTVILPNNAPPVNLSTSNNCKITNLPPQTVHTKNKEKPLFFQENSSKSAISEYSNVRQNTNNNSTNSYSMYAENPATKKTSKRRFNDDSNDPKTSYSKKQYNCSNNNDLVKKESIKNSFLPASSMYKNPLKKASNDRKQEESMDCVEDGSDIKKHPSLKNFDAKIVGIILSEIMDFSPDIKWTDIAGLDFVKSTVQEIVIWPLLRPDIFTGLRAPPRGILLFGPPGTGKTLIGKCIATESNSTFFCISASSLASKWVGESEQLVRALFAVAQLHQPAVIFIDEIDSLLSQRSDQEQDHTRKLKTEFLVQFDGAKTNSERRVLVVGATNRPHELDEAARRRFVKRLYVPLPEEHARLQIIEKLLGAHQHILSKTDLKQICDGTKGYSGSDVAHLCKEAAMGPIRSIGPEQIKTVSLDKVRPIELADFLDALKQVRASVDQKDLNYYLDWNKKFGSFAI